MIKKTSVLGSSIACADFKFIENIFGRSEEFYGLEARCSAFMTKRNTMDVTGVYLTDLRHFFSNRRPIEKLW